LAKGFEQDNKGALTQAIVTTYATNGGGEQWPYVYQKYSDAGPQGKFALTRSFAAMTSRVDKPEFAQQGITAIKDLGVKYKQFGIGPFITGLLTDIKTARTKLNDTASATAADNAIKAVNDAK
jgi:aminopeptidase N